jgi:hypothetical protein
MARQFSRYTEWLPAMPDIDLTGRRKAGHFSMEDCPRQAPEKSIDSRKHFQQVVSQFIDAH